MYVKVAEKTGKPCRTYSFVADVAGWSVMGAMRCTPLLQALTNEVCWPLPRVVSASPSVPNTERVGCDAAAHQVEVNYPEIVGPIILINAPSAVRHPELKLNIQPKIPA